MRIAQDDLRALVLEWVSEEREVRGRATQLEHEAERLKELQFGARAQALAFAQEHGLVEWQQEKFAELFLDSFVFGSEPIPSVAEGGPAGAACMHDFRQ